MLQLSADDLQQIRNAMYHKQIFQVVDETTLSDIQYTNIFVGSLETPHVSYLYDCQPLLCATALLKQLAMLLDLLESTETLSVCYCLMLQNI